MLPADEYERIWRTQGPAAANAEFNRQMRWEHVKIAIAGVILLCLLGLTIATI